MNSILEALKKSTKQAPAEPVSTKDFLFNRSPYESSSVYWERQKLREERGLRRIVVASLILGGVSVVGVVVLLLYLALGANRKPQPVSAPLVTVVTSASQPSMPYPPRVAVRSVPLPAQYAPSVADLPQPFEQSAAPATAAPSQQSEPQPLPLDLPQENDPAAIPPAETPVPATEVVAAEAAVPDSLPYEMPPIAPPQEAARVQSTPEPAYALQGIIWDDKAPMAMVNKRTVRVGDKVGEAVVREINQNTVVLDVNGQRVDLR